MYYFEKERKLFPGKLPTKQVLCCHLIQLLLRFLKSTQEIYVQHKELKTERERLYQAALQSQMLGERRPMTVVSMAIKFNAACHELGSQQFPGVDIEAQMSTKQKLLAAAMEEYHTHSAGNNNYALTTHQRDATFNLCLHSVPGFLKEVQSLLDTCPEKNNPWKLKILVTKRWIIGGQSSKIGQADAGTKWAACLQMTPGKQVLLGKVVSHQTKRHLRSGRQKGLTLEEFSELCDYSCWCGYFLLNADKDEELIQKTTERCNPA